MITPLFDPRGNSWIHQAYPTVKILWLLSIAISAAISNNSLFLAFVFIECLSIFRIISARKETPAPPIGTIVVFAVFLLFGLNYLLWGSHLGLWKFQEETAIYFSPRFEYSLSRSLALGSTMLSFFDLTLSTFPRDLARSLERIKISRLICEPLAIALRFLPVFEVSLKMQYRMLLIKSSTRSGSNNHKLSSRLLFILLQAILVMALSQANLTGKSLELRGFNRFRRKHSYNPFKPSLGDFIFFLLSIINIVIAARLNT